MNHHKMESDRDRRYEKYILPSRLMQKKQLKFVNTKSNILHMEQNTTRNITGHTTLLAIISCPLRLPWSNTSRQNAMYENTNPTPVTMLTFYQLSPSIPAKNRQIKNKYDEKKHTSTDAVFITRTVVINDGLIFFSILRR